MITMRFEGGQELERALGQLSLRLGKKILNEALREGAEPIRKAAAAKAPRSSDSEHIAENIGISNARPQQLEDRGDIAAAINIGPVKGFAYGLPLEIGTVKAPAQPFMRPAFDTQVDRALKIIGDAAWRELAGKGIGRFSTVATPIESEGPLL